MYLDSLDMTAKDMEAELDADEEGKQLHDAVRFMESVRKGETVVESVPMTEEQIEELKNAQKEAMEKEEGEK